MLKKLASDRRLWILVPAVLCAYTHMWNPAGFPDLYDDESVYIARGLGVLDGTVVHGYDHPFFGQVALAGFMAAAGYPDLSGAPDPEELEYAYAAPRTLMGLLAVADAVLIYLIAERRYGARAAALASLLFAVMPASLVLRHVLLDSILLPPLLLSILLAMHAHGPPGRLGRHRQPILLAAAGACVGLAVLTKVPALSAVPLAAALAYSARGRLAHLAAYLAPAALTASAWPAAAALAGELPAWLEAVLWQAGRSNAGLPSAAAVMFMADPAMAVLGACGLAYAAAARDRFLLLWALPTLALFGLLGYVAYYHLAILLPAACVASAVLLVRLAGRAPPAWRGRASAASALAVAAFGLSVSGAVVHADASEAQLAAISHVLENHASEKLLVSNQTYGWLPARLHGAELVHYYALPAEPPEGAVMVAGSWLRGDAAAGGGERASRLQNFYGGASQLASFESPPLGGPWQQWYAGSLYAELRRALDPQTGQSPFFEHGRWAARGASVEVLRYG